MKYLSLKWFKSINWDYKKITILTVFISLLIIIPLLLLFIYTNHSVSAFNLSADFAIGQADLVSPSINASGSGANPFGYNYQSGLVSDGTHLFVSDLNNNRILIYNTIPSSSSQSADLVIGQSNLNSGNANQGATPSAFTLNNPRFVDTNGTKLFIADTLNNRVLIYNTIPTVNNASADVVIGQVDMASASANQGNSTPSANTLFRPWSVIFNTTSGKLFISDSGNNRVLIYNSVPTTNNATADAVLGQPNFITSALGITSSQNLSSPSAARVIQSQLIIADTGNNRVLTFSTVPTTNYASASAVIGQVDMASASANQGTAVAGNTLKSPSDIMWDGTRLLIQDSGNNRVLAFNPIPSTNNVSADDAIGQINLTSNSIGTTAATLNNPAGELSFSGTSLFIGDSSNNRVLAFNSFGPSPTPTNTPTPTAPPPAATAPVCSSAKPATPTGLTVTSGSKTGQLVLTWTAAADPVTDYSIVYSNDQTSQKWGVVSTGKVTTYTISDLNPSTIYYFWVNAVNGCMPGDKVGPATLGGGSVSTVSTPSGSLTSTQFNSLSASGSASLPPTGPADLVKFGSIGIIFVIIGAAVLLAL